jgi:hypothetical protein
MSLRDAKTRGLRRARAMMRREAEAMVNPFRAKPKPFLDDTRREWQFACFAWLLRHCGGYPKFLETLPVLPIEEHFPESGMSGHAGVTALFRRVRDHAGMAEWPCMVEPLPANPPVSASAEGIRVCYYDSRQRQPTVLVAHFARELARYLVENFDDVPPGGRALSGPATDIAAVFIGFGVFLANAAVESDPGDLNEGERVHALAMFCRLRRMPPETLESYLNPHLRKYLRLAARDLAQYEHGFSQLRCILGPHSAGTGERAAPR